MTVDLHRFGYEMRDLGVGLQLLWEHFNTDPETIEQAWRDQFQGQEWLFSDTTAFCRVAAGVRAVGDWLCRMDFPGQTLHYVSVSTDGRSLISDTFEAGIESFLWEPQRPPVGITPDEVEWAVGTFRDHFETCGVPFPTPGLEADRSIIHAVSVGVIRAMRAMHERFGPSPLDDEGAYDLMMLGLRAHLGSAPREVDQAVWPEGTRRSDGLDATTPLSRASLAAGCAGLRWGVSVATRSGWDAGKEPVDVLERALRARRADVQRVHDARHELDSIARRDGEIRGYLRQSAEVVLTTPLWLSPDSELLTGSGLDPGPHLRAVSELESAGRFRQRGVRSDVAASAERLLAEWDAKLAPLQIELEQRREHAKLAKEQRKQWFRAWDDGMLDFIALRDFAANTYAPGKQDLYFAGELATGVLDRETEAVPWFLPVEQPPTLIFYLGDTVFPGDVMKDVNVLLASRLAYRRPGSFAITWLDPAQTGDPGLFRQLLTASAALGHGGLATDAGQMRERLASLESHVDSSNADGSAADLEHVVVVPCFPTGFDEETGPRLLAVADRGASVGIQMVVVIDETESPQWLTPHALHPIPHVPIIRGPDLKGNIPGWGFIPYDVDGEIVRLVYTAPRMRAEEVEIIVDGYMQATLANA